MGTSDVNGTLMARVVLAIVIAFKIGVESNLLPVQPPFQVRGLGGSR
jgi:hypothetical protein